MKLTIPDIRHHRQGVPLLGDGRLVKTHEPYRREYKKAIYMVRDPRDVAVSLYEYDKPGQNLDNFVRSFVRGHASPHGTWQRNVSSWLDSPLAANGRLLVINYESLVLDVEGTLADVLEFLGCPAEPETLRNAVSNNDFQHLRVKEDRARAVGIEVSGEKIRSVGRGIRHGSVGEWRQRLTEAQIQLIEDHAGELLTRLGYAHYPDLPSPAVQPEELPVQDFARAESLPEVGEASA